MQTKLIRLRKYFGYTQKQMAEYLNVDERTYINKEHGNTQFKLNEMFLIARKFNMDVGEIFLPTNFVNHEVYDSVLNRSNLVK